MAVAYDPRRPPLVLLVPALAAGAGMLVPLGYLVTRALEGTGAGAAELILRARTLELLGNTLALVACVLALSTLIALPLALLVTRTDLAPRRAISILCVLPLAIPGYVMAYALIGLSGYYGFLNAAFGVTLPRLQGLFGATLALSLYVFPYIFLNLRSALLGMDPSLVEAARSLGRSPWRTFRDVTLPHLMPALLSGWLVVGLYVIGDFGAVALMRYEVFSYAIYNQYAGAFDRVYAAWLSLILVALTVSILFAEGFLARRRRYARTGTGVARAAAPFRLGRWRPLAYAFLGLVFAASIGLPLAVILYWMSFGGEAVDWSRIAAAAARTAATAAPAAALATLLALPVALLSARFSSRPIWFLERLAYFGYAVPPLPFALAMVFFALSTLPALYQTLPLLVLAYGLSFLALAVGPARAALLQAGGRMEEAARSLGRSGAAAFLAVTLPTISRSLVAGFLLVFILVVKELPIAALLAPTGWTTLSMNVFSRTVEGQLFEAAPYALITVVFSSLFVGLILSHEGRRR
ncbi:ABC transporter permease [Antarcticirhabdus aurantiaca]|uniref:Iron ABC transporter permease n=1 Tax=Antarcticirhabdus aurantiaca TaxID=2606717 RepID=A0ACD4NTS5_9HYPH|nr:iron ABC transporter permease [Antarcticirhabdus aurantiaca]WAJ30212.1 iron ABC transporter permease [Jeongeuplla avenae]